MLAISLMLKRPVYVVMDRVGDTTVSFGIEENGERLVLVLGRGYNYKATMKVSGFEASAETPPSDNAGGTPPGGYRSGTSPGTRPALPDTRPAHPVSSADSFIEPLNSQLPGLREPVQLENIAGWYRSGRKGRNVLLRYGLLDDPLYEIKAGAEVGNLMLSSMGLEELDTLTALQQRAYPKTTSKIWEDNTKIINVARSSSEKRPIIWVQLNCGTWMSRSFLESFRLPKSGRPLGTVSALEVIMDCVKRKKNNYTLRGHHEAGEVYYNSFVDAFGIIAERKLV
jgi:hypothetical protein